MTQPIHPMLERVATALNDELMRRANHVLESGLSHALARAAVQALMEPDEGMVEVGGDALWEGDGDGTRNTVVNVFQAMLRPLVEGETS